MLSRSSQKAAVLIAALSSGFAFEEEQAEMPETGQVEEVSRNDFEMGANITSDEIPAHEDVRSSLQAVMKAMGITLER